MRKPGCHRRCASQTHSTDSLRSLAHATRSWEQFDEAATGSLNSCQRLSFLFAQNLLPSLGLLLALITAAVFASTGSAFAAGTGSVAGSPRFAPGRILVAPKPGSADTDFQQALFAQGGHSLGRLQGIDVHMVEVPSGSEQDAVARLAANPLCAFCRARSSDVACSRGEISGERSLLQQRMASCENQCPDSMGYFHRQRHHHCDSRHRG